MYILIYFKLKIILFHHNNITFLAHSLIVGKRPFPHYGRYTENIIIHTTFFSFQCILRVPILKLELLGLRLWASLVAQLAKNLPAMR